MAFTGTSKVYVVPKPRTRAREESEGRYMR